MHATSILNFSKWTPGAAKFQVNVKEWERMSGRGGGGSIDLNVQLTLSGEKVNLSKAPKMGRNP